MIKRIALKIDVDSYRGTLFGVPTLLSILQRHGASGSFFFSLGPDQGGREARLSSLCRYYGLGTRLYGRFLPAPNISMRCAARLLQVRDAGFEVGIHAWNRVAWEKKILSAPSSWVEAEMVKARTKFSEIFADTAKAHAAPGWRMNRHALRLTQRLGFDYASDSRGNFPFIPVVDGEIIACPQLPTTLPTLDEVLTLEPDFSAEQAVDRILQLSNAIPGDHVFTLRAELEGMRFVDAFERLIVGWQAQQYELVALRDIAANLDIRELPRHSVCFSESPGRSGERMVQGPVFLQG